MKKNDAQILAEQIANLIRDIGDARETVKESVQVSINEIKDVKKTADYLAGQVSVFNLAFEFFKDRVKNIEFDHKREKIYNENEGERIKNRRLM